MLLVPAVYLHVHPALAADVAAAAALAALAAAAVATASITSHAAIRAAYATWLSPDRRELLHDRERLLRWRPHFNDERVRCRRHSTRPVRPVLE